MAAHFDPGDFFYLPGLRSLHNQPLLIPPLAVLQYFSYFSIYKSRTSCKPTFIKLLLLIFFSILAAASATNPRNDFYATLTPDNVKYSVIRGQFDYRLPPIDPASSSYISSVTKTPSSSRLPVFATELRSTTSESTAAFGVPRLMSLFLSSRVASTSIQAISIGFGVIATSVSPCAP